jgi:hypothetical protein
VCGAGTSNIELAKVVAGAYTQIWLRTATVAAGDTVRLEAQGTTLRAYVNGVQVGADATDSAIATGNAGVVYSSSITTKTGDDWEGGTWSAGSPPASSPPVPASRRVQTLMVR